MLGMSDGSGLNQRGSRWVRLQRKKWPEDQAVKSRTPLPRAGEQMRRRQRTPEAKMAIGHQRPMHEAEGGQQAAGKATVSAIMGPGKGLVPWAKASSPLPVRREQAQVPAKWSTRGRVWARPAH